MFIHTCVNDALENPVSVQIGKKNSQIVIFNNVRFNISKSIHLRKTRFCNKSVARKELKFTGLLLTIKKCILEVALS